MVWAGGPAESSAHSRLRKVASQPAKVGASLRRFDAAAARRDLEIAGGDEIARDGNAGGDRFGGGSSKCWRGGLPENHSGTAHQRPADEAGAHGVEPHGEENCDQQRRCCDRNDRCLRLARAARAGRMRNMKSPAGLRRGWRRRRRCFRAAEVARAAHDFRGDARRGR